VLGNPSGGIKQGSHYDGLLDVYMDVDFEKAAGWKGLCFHVNGYQIHGTSITARDLSSIASASNIEAFPSTRLDELWFEQKLLSDKVSVRFGELAIDTEFMIADSAGAFIDSTFGWTTLSSANLPFSGPIYPFASPGLRVRVQYWPTVPRISAKNVASIISITSGITITSGINSFENLL
jgi:porin